MRASRTMHGFKQRRAVHIGEPINRTFYLEEGKPLEVSVTLHSASGSPYVKHYQLEVFEKGCKISQKK
jgi:hypothetical protein